jgi:uncharacterized protein YciI
MVGNSLERKWETGMLYALICTDKPNSLALRQANRPEHLAYLKSLGGSVVLAGPFTETDGETMNGSLIVVEAASLQAARDMGGRPLRQGRTVRVSRDQALALDPQ